MKRWLIALLPLTAMVALACLFGFYALQRGTTRIEPDFTVGKPAPEMMLSYLEGGPPVSLLAQVKGPALVNLFGSWCVPCAGESHYLVDLQKAGARIVGVDEGENGEADPPEKVAAFLAQNGDPYAVVLTDPKAQATIDFGATGVPETFVVDSHGMIVGKISTGLASPDDVASMLAKVKAAR